MSKKSQAGIAHILILLAAVGLIVFLLVSSSADFRDKLFGNLYPKNFGFASGPINPPPVSGPVSPTPFPYLTATANPGRCLNNSNIGSVAWVNPERARLNDNQWAYTSLVTPSGKLTSNTLACLGFGLNIPQTATIKGVKVNIKRGYDPTKGSASDALVRLFLGATITSDDRAGSMPYNNGEGVYGGSNDLWGKTWTPAQINNGAFGLAFVTTGNTFVGVDGIIMSVYYTP